MMFSVVRCLLTSHWHGLATGCRLLTGWCCPRSSRPRTFNSELGTSSAKARACRRRFSRSKTRRGQEAADDHPLPRLGRHGKGPPTRAIAFARAGYLAVAFDYRGWGDSDARLVLAAPAPAGRSGSRFTAEVEGVREVVDPLDQTTDLMNAIHWVAGEPQCDITGSGCGGRATPADTSSMPLRAIRASRRSSARSRLSIRAGWSWDRAAREQTYREATRRARGEDGYPEPGKRVILGLKGAPIRERMMNYAPVDDVDKATGCAMLFILAEKEEYFDNKDHGLKAFERAKGTQEAGHDPGDQPLRNLRQSPPAGPEAGHRMVRRATQGEGKGRRLRRQRPMRRTDRHTSCYLD